MNKIIFTLTMAICLLTTNLIFADGWTQKTDFGGTGRFGPFGFNIGTKGYIGLGSDAYPVYNFRKDFWEYDPTANTWTQKADFGGTARYSPAVFVIGTIGYVFGGWDQANTFSDFWQYNQTTNTWTQKTDNGIMRTAGVGFAIGNKGYIGTGWDGSIDRNDFWQYDPSNDTWTQMANFGGAGRVAGVGFAFDNLGFIGLGNTAYPGDNYVNDFWQYNQSSNTWTIVDSFPGIPREDPSCFTLFKKCYAGTGYDMSGNVLNDFYMYDSQTNQWTQKANYPPTAGMNGGTGFSVGSYGYYGTGMTQSNVPQKTFYQYNPSNVGIDEVSQTIFNVSLYPNPTNGKFKIDFTVSKPTSLDLSIVDITGKIIHFENKHLVSGYNQITFDLSNEAKGMYFIELISEGNSIAKKVLID